MKSKGFTLIELLAVIVVLGIIMLIAVTAVNNVIINSRLSGFKSSSQMLEKAASTYLNTNNLIVGTGSTLEISYNTLKTNGHINKVSDPKSNSECTNSRVYVKNVSGTYKYTGALVCDNYMDMDAYNLLTNGNFSNGTTGWTTENNTQTVSNGVLTITGNGGSQYPGPFQITTTSCVTNHKIYVKAKAMVTNSICGGIIIQVSGSAGTSSNGPFINAAVYNNPQANSWYNLSGIATLTTQPVNITVRLIESYNDSATANGKVMQVDGTKGVYAFDLTAIYGSGNEPTVAQMDSIMSNMGK